MTDRCAHCGGPLPNYHPPTKDVPGWNDPYCSRECCQAALVGLNQDSPANREPAKEPA